MSYNAIDAVKDVITGNVYWASDDKVSQRKSICEQCENRSMLGVCKSCGCIIASKVKFEHSQCPEGKW